MQEKENYVCNTLTGEPDVKPSHYNTIDWNWANTENIRIGLVFAVLAQ
jgi:hypothetical protein